MFSELVDMVVRRTNRPDFKEDIIAYANEVIRMCHCSEFFFRDKTEVLLNQDYDRANPSETFVWERPKDLRALFAIKYYGYYDDPRDAFPANIPPGIGQAMREQFYYGVGNSYVFYRKSGLHEIAICYAKAPKRFKYYAVGKRPAVYNRGTGEWLYLDRYGNYVTSLGSDELDQAARDEVSDWLLADYDGMLCSGVNTKVFTVLGDPRNKVEYSNFKENLRYVRTTERYESTGEVGYDR